MRTIKISPRKSTTDHLTYLDLAGSWDGDDVVALLEHPSNGNLPSCSVVLSSDLLQAGSKLEDVREVLLGIAGDGTAEIVLLKVLRSFLR